MTDPSTDPSETPPRLGEPHPLPVVPLVVVEGAAPARDDVLDLGDLNGGEHNEADVARARKTDFASAEYVKSLERALHQILDAGRTIDPGSQVGGYWMIRLVMRIAAEALGEKI